MFVESFIASLISRLTVVLPSTSPIFVTLTEIWMDSPMYTSSGFIVRSDNVKVAGLAAPVIVPSFNR